MKELIYSIFVIIGLIVATILGIYGQDISYYLNENFPKIGITIIFTIVTFLSIGLYIIIPVLLFNLKNLNKVLFKTYLIANVVLGFPISMWSIFVWAMGMG